MESEEIRFLRLPEVSRIVGLGRTQIYELESKGRFPRRIKLTERATVWRSDEVRAFIEARTAAARGVPAQ